VTAANANPQQVLQEEILADARRHADATVRSARQEADAILAKAKAEAESDRQSRLKAAEAEARRRYALTLATIPIQVARRRAECVEAALEQVRQEARRLLEARQGFDYREALTRLAAEALAAMEGTRFVLQVADADRQALGDAWLDEVRRRVGRQGLELSLEPAQTKPAAGAAGSISNLRSQIIFELNRRFRVGLGGGGVFLRDDEGRQVWDNRFEARLARLWPALRCDIAAATGLVSAAPPPSTGGRTGPQKVLP
jgi:vacuolar-type H+-ATPase subunit E/Vma4